MRQTTTQTFARTDATDSFAGQQTSPGWSGMSAAYGYTARRVGRPAPAAHSELDGMIARHAQANGLPVELVHRVVKRESGYNPRARNPSGALGLMQIKHATARGVGYTGSASGLLDAETNLTYAVRYLAGAYQAAGGNANRAVALYQSGYHGRGVARRERPTLVAEQPASQWGSQQWGERQVTSQQWASQQWNMQSTHVAMRDTDITAVRAHRTHRWRHRR
jgi:hypothetical protein